MGYKWENCRLILCGLSIKRLWHLNRVMEAVCKETDLAGFTRLIRDWFVDKHRPGSQAFRLNL